MKRKNSFAYIIQFTVIILWMIIMPSCEKDDVISNTQPLAIYALPNNDTLPALITENTLLLAGRTWYVRGIVYVVNEATLRIDSGTVIRMIHQPGEDNDHPASGIVVSRGAKIVAKGGRRHPIYFKIADSALYRRSAWNGIIVLGKAPSNNIDITFNHFPWIKNSLGYAGDMPDDSSGVLEHIMIDRNNYLHSPVKGDLPGGLHLISTGTRTVVKDIKIRSKGIIPLR